jgi:hypothetical protein
MIYVFWPEKEKKFEEEKPRRTSFIFSENTKSEDSEFNDNFTYNYKDSLDYQDKLRFKMME